MINFNTAPYYDNFDPSQNYHRILFKPGYAVQARELTQSQTILQDQISKFADNIFSQNTPVTGGNVTTNLNCNFIKLNPTFGTSSISATAFLNKIIEDSTGTVVAKVIAATEATGTVSTSGDPPTLIVTYYSGSHFTDNMQLQTVDGTNLFATVAASTTGNPSTGFASTASISDGVFYVVNGYSYSSTQNADGTYSKYSIGNFVSVQPQTIILDKYDNTPSYRIGLLITETIADYISDNSLLDPAVGASNYQAPGADRYQITLSLTTLPLTLGNDDAFIELVRVENGNIVKQVDGTVYSVIDDYFAKRDYETNGDYIVDDFKLTPSANTSNSAQYDLKIGKGVAYVRGYRIENQSDLTLTSDRARTTQTINTNSVYFDYGSYFYVDTLKGIFDVTTMPFVDFHCVPSQNINSTNNITYASTLVGSGNIRNLQFVNNTSDSNTQSYVYEAFVNSVNSQVLTGNVSSATTSTITVNDPNGHFSSVANAYYGVSMSITKGTDLGDVRKVVSYNGSTKTFTVDTPFTVTPDNTSQFSLLFSTSSIESIVQANTNYAVVTSANINNESKVNGISTGDTIFENSGTPELVFQIGYPYVSSLANSSYTSTKIFRNQTFQTVGNTSQLSLTLSSPFQFEGLGTLSGASVKQNFIVINTSTGQLLDFSSSGNTISISSDHYTATLSSNAYGNPTVDVYATTFITDAQNSLVLKAKNLISGNTQVFSNTGPSGIINSNTYVDLTNGQVYVKNAVARTSPISLYVTDVKKVKKIVDTKGQTPSTSMLTNSAYDVTNFYALNNGQRDSYYDHASISLIPGAPLPIGDLLVIFDYYQHTSGDGYFSVLSYLSPLSTSPENYAQIPTYTSKHGTQYNLSDCLDFRPSRQNATTTFSIEVLNPGASSGMLIPQNLSQYISQYSFYLGRKDKLVLTKDKSFQIVEGTPSNSPAFPVEPNGSLVLAELALDPYTAYVPGEAPAGTQSNLSINKIAHYRWTKSDITNLQTRVNNLEYYTSLSLLEQNAQSLQVPDNNGLNRFKNGILVDDFSSYSTADTYNQDFAANINIRKQTMGPVSIVENYQLQNPIVLGSLGTLSNTNTYAISSINGTHTNIYTLPYTLANVVVQPLASSTVSLNPFAVTIYEGVAQLTPPMDNWVDNQQAPAILITDPSMQIYQQTNGVNVTNAGDFATIPGTTISSSTSSSVSVLNHGRFNGPFGSVVGYTATTTQTYTSSQQQGNVTTTAGYAAASSLSTNNGYITNIAVLPYIRPQQIIVKAKGLLINSNVSTWFDGINVDQFISSPETMELAAVNGSFNEGDVVGYMSVGVFYPTARVISVYNYPGTSNTRLYVAKVTGTPEYTTSTTIQNAFFDANGNYLNSSASGTINTSGAVTQISASGQVTGVGGSYSNGSGSGLQIYKVYYPQGWSSFMNQYAVWSDLNRSLGPWTPTFDFTATLSGTYTFLGSADNSASFTIVDTTTSTTVLSFSSSSSTTTTVQTVSLVAGRVYQVSWSATNNSTTTPAGVALVAKDPTGNIVFASSNPPNMSYTGVQSETVMPLGGAYFSGVTQVKLDQGASSVPNFYVGATLNITTKLVYDYTTQTATYVPPPPAPSGGAGGGGGGCCVVATAMTNNGVWNEKQLVSLNVWAVKKLDQSFIGERLHRGYHIIAPKIIIPMMKNNIGKKYVEWSFSNATNMLRGKTYDKLSVPNSLFWISLMTITGFFVSKEKAENSWKSLYKNKSRK